MTDAKLTLYAEISYDATPPPEVSYNPNHFPRNPYGYVPTQWICAVFVVLFSLSTGAPMSFVVSLPTAKGPRSLFVQWWTDFEPCSFPRRPSHPYSSLVALPHCGQLRCARDTRLGGSALVLAKRLPQDPVPHSVGAPFVDHVCHTN